MKTWPVKVVALFTIVACCGAFGTDLNAEGTPLKNYQQALFDAVQSEPTSVANAEERAREVWRWVNEFSLNDGYVPVNLTQNVSSILAYPSRRRPSQFSAMDHYIRELAMMQTDPNAIGHLMSEGSPFKANEYGTLIQTYVVGTKAIEAGGGLVIGRHIMNGVGRYQYDEPEAPNYVSVVTSNPNVDLYQDTYQMGGMHGGFRGALPVPYFRVESGTLQTGDTVTITYGDTSQGSPGIRMSDTSSDFTPFPLYVALDDSRALYSLPIPSVEVTGADIAGVRVFAPSVVKAGEAFEVSIRAQDAYFNRATSEIPDWILYLNDEQVAEVQSQNEAISVVRLDGLLTPGVYYPFVVGGDFSGEGNPILVEENPARYIYWGDTHAHSGFAEGIGSSDQLMRWAKEDARLDYVTHSEHDIWMDDSEWNKLITNVEEYSDDEFIAYLGYEWTVQNLQGGHHNVLFRTAEGRKRIPAQTHGSLTKLYFGLRQHHDPLDVIVIPHAHQPGDYRLSDPDLEPLVEILSQHGTFEWFGRMYLQNGHQVGFTAASDNHLAQPGYSKPRGGSLSQIGGLGAVVAKEKTRDGIFDAMKDLSAYATTGDRIILDVDLNGASMGQRTVFAQDRQISGEVIGTAPIDVISVIKNGEEFWTKDYRTETEQTQPSDGLYQLVFESKSQPYHQYDNPRGWRHWAGNLEVTNAELTEVHGMRTDEQAGENFELQPDGIDFATSTRGNVRSILLQLSNVSHDTTLEFALNATRETGGGPPKYRRAQAVPESNLTLSFENFQHGKIHQTLTLVGYTDSVTLRKVRQNGEKHVRFEVIDTSDKQGDYYYVRVLQANDAIAYSSPIWVGGFGPN